MSRGSPTIVSLKTARSVSAADIRTCVVKICCCQEGPLNGTRNKHDMLKIMDCEKLWSSDVALESFCDSRLRGVEEALLLEVTQRSSVEVLS